MSNPLEKYQKLGLKEALSRIYRYPKACKELSFILRGAYNKLPKNVQALIFQDTLTAFRLLPPMQTSSAVSAAHLLLQSAEASLPKQKKNLAITEFKHAKVAFKRHSKSCQDAKGTVQLPQDVLIHIFSFLDMPSLVSVELVSWSWNLAASDNHLWQSQYNVFFGNYMNSSKTKVQQSNKVVKDKKHALLQEDEASQNCVDWREAFKRAYIGNSSKNLTSDRGFCGHCNAVVWLNNLKCSNVHCGLKSQKQIKHILPSQVVEYLLEDRSPMISSSDSDSESDEESISRLWAYPKHLQL
ncbi:F-box protein At5g52880 [Mangifera indica]|uniref:F-box protein At5g52880 n=1 Tax=Mangifera indica TaxID=29780 RepID=UPI001CFA1DD9|nr:F-box protein At5g52880 [Mangifera indica]